MLHRVDNSCPDDRLLILLQEDNKAAFDMIYSRYWQQLFLYVTKVVADSDEAKDIIQEVFVSLWTRRLELGEIVSLKAYLFTAARYKALTHLKNSADKAGRIESLGAFAEQASDCVNQQLHVNELSRLISREVEKLPAKMKEVFILSREEHLSYKSISEKLMISDKTVKKQINNVLKHLRLILAEK